MQQRQETVRLHTDGRGLVDISSEVEAIVRRANVQTGLCTVFVRHTSASLVIQENADPAVRVDMEAYFDRIAPEGDPAYTHTMEGPDDMPAHLRSALTRTAESIPVVGGQLALGTWQGLYLFEHRRRPHHRTVVVHVLGE